MAAIAAAVVTIWKALTKAGSFLALKLFDEHTGLITRLVCKHVETMDRAQEAMETVAQAVTLQEERDKRRDVADAQRDRLLDEIRQQLTARPCLQQQPGN